MAKNFIKFLFKGVNNAPMNREATVIARTPIDNRTVSVVN